MTQTGPVGHKELAQMPYLEACFKVGALCVITRYPTCLASVVACQNTPVAASALLFLVS